MALMSSLPAAFASRPLADQHAFGLAASEFEDAVGDEIVEEDHVGGLQRAHGLQRQKLGFAGAGADESDTAAGLRRTDEIVDQPAGIGPPRSPPASWS